MTADRDIRRLSKLAVDVVNRVPERPNKESPRSVETLALRASHGGGGVARAGLLDQMNVDGQLMVAHLTLLVDGVADALELASQRDNEVNGPALAQVVRASLELVGQLAWLLSDEVGAELRARRYLIWRLADLRAQRMLLRDFRSPPDEINDARQDLDEAEEDLLSDVESAKWTSRPTAYEGPHLQPAALLRADSKPEKMPKLGELVREVSSSPALYGLLSATAHSQRFGMFQGLRTGATKGSATVSGLPISTNLLVGFSILAINIGTRMLGGWNSVDVGEFHALSTDLTARTQSHP